MSVGDRRIEFDDHLGSFVVDMRNRAQIEVYRKVEVGMCNKLL